MIRVSATLLETYRLYATTEWMKEADLAAAIRGEVSPTPAMALGRAYHAVLERPQRSLTDECYERWGWRFDRTAVETMLDKLGPGVFEAKATRELAGVRLVAKADHLSGLHLSEIKTTLDSPNLDKYLDSYQWRVMALLFQPQIITYHVAHLEPGGDGYTLRSIDSINMYPYTDLEWDCRELLAHFLDYVHARGLEEHLREKAEAL